MSRVIGIDKIRDFHPLFINTNEMKITIKDTWIAQAVFGLEVVLNNQWICLGFFWSSLLFYIFIKEWLRYKGAIPQPNEV